MHRFPVVGPAGRLLLLFLGTVAGCQSLTGSLPEQKPATTGPRVQLTQRSADQVAGQSAESPVRLTGLVAEETAGSSSAGASSGDAAARDVRPVFFGHSAISDPNADDVPDAGDETRQLLSKPDPSEARHRLVSLFGDDPSELFRRNDAAQDVAPHLADGDSSSAEPPAFPRLFVPEDPAEGGTGSPEQISVMRDLREIIPTLWDDTKSLVTWRNGITLAAAAGGAVAIRETGVDQYVRRDTFRHKERWDEWDEVLRQFGEPVVQMPVLAAFYGYAVWQQDPELHDYSRALIHGYGLSSLITLAIKGAADTSRPTTDYQNGRWGFPSFHTSSLFSIGGVTEEYYGAEVALPIYILGGLVGWSRIDQRKHDLSDVLFGAVLGYVVGRTVGANHLRQGERHWDVQPYVDPENHASGVTLRAEF